MSYEFLDNINSPADLKKLSVPELKLLAVEIRLFLTEIVSQNGGHLAPNLGVVELTLALHTIFDSPQDKIIWDVGHQSYIHKIITGRRELFHTLREYGGLSGFPKKSESPHDHFETGHSSTSISVALGMACARDIKGDNYRVIAVIGDGALTGGMAFEALNNAGEGKNDLLVVLNDNEMSINENVGGMAAYLGRVRVDPKYNKLKEDVEYILKRIPAIGDRVAKTVERIKDSFKYLVVPGVFFEELGFTYLGPVNGHSISSLQEVLSRIKQIKGPVLLHVLTKKGKGYAFAEEKPDKFHGIGPFNIKTANPVKKADTPTYTEVFGATLKEIAVEKKDVVAITAAMAGGTGLDSFAAAFPDRFYDVGIAEQHAVTFAAGLATQGFKPVVAVYSTFLQRAYDQILHDVALQNLPVVFAVDRAGLVGEDGPTHHGVFDISFLRSIPGMVIMAPRNEAELRHMLSTAINLNCPCVVRYPRGTGEGVSLKASLQDIPLATSEVIKEGKDLAIFALGTMVKPALQASEMLLRYGIKAAVINPRFAAPLDRKMILSQVAKCGRIITVEENVLAGGFGSGVLEVLEEESLFEVQIKRLGLPSAFAKHGARAKLLDLYGLNSETICQTGRDLCGLKLCESKIKEF